MILDCELLRRYAETQLEDALAELVRRHINLVYLAAMRQVNGDSHLAQEVAQTVFTELAESDFAKCLLKASMPHRVARFESRSIWIICSRVTDGS